MMMADRKVSSAAGGKKERRQSAKKKIRPQAADGKIASKAVPISAVKNNQSH